MSRITSFFSFNLVVLLLLSSLTWVDMASNMGDLMWESLLPSTFCMRNASRVASSTVGEVLVRRKAMRSSVDHLLTV